MGEVMTMSHYYRLQRWQLHGRLQQARDLLRTLEQQLSQIDNQLQQLEPDADTDHAAKPLAKLPQQSAAVTVIRQQQSFPLPIAAG
jgi:CII-binding regulator of phage lambda lysogenization HflD